mmetsp:Transcript_13752/g.24446  ORF Transcript_13752/g.24446 Transcript_13752/m.24446 type:complete len:112 (-) Transcript_13752:56-391(-)
MQYNPSRIVECLNHYISSKNSPPRKRLSSHKALKKLVKDLILPKKDRSNLFLACFPQLDNYLSLAIHLQFQLPQQTPTSELVMRCWLQMSRVLHPKSANQCNIGSSILGPG